MPWELAEVCSRVGPLVAVSVRLVPPLTMAPCKTCNKPIGAKDLTYHCVVCETRMHLNLTCTGHSNVAINGIKELGVRVALFCDDCVENNRKDHLLNTIQANEKLNCKLESLERTIEKSIDEKVSSVVEKCETRFEEVVMKIIEKRLEPQIKAIGNKTGPLKTPKAHHNVKSSFRVRGLPEDLTKNKEANALLANEKLKEVTTEIGVDVKIERLQRLGKFDKERPTPRNVIATLSYDWDVRIVLAKGPEIRKRMKEMGIHILPTLSAVDARRENMCLKKRRELLNNGITPSHFKIRNFELFQGGVLLPLSEEQPEQD